MARNNRKQQQPRDRGSQIPVLATASRRLGLHSGGPPSEPETEVQPPRMTIRLPARVHHKPCLGWIPAGVIVPVSIRMIPWIPAAFDVGPTP